MAAGLGFKDFVTGEVLTAGDVDGYLMQGIWVFANAAARDAAVTSPQEGNACYLKDTDVIQVYTGSTWAAQSASNPISANIVDAKGDIIAATAADTVSRLAVGANDTVLTADSTTATGLKWAAVAGGGMTSLASGSLSGTSVTLSSISSSYNDLRLIVRKPYFGSNAAVKFKINTVQDNSQWSRVTGPPSTTSTGAGNTASTEIAGNYNALENNSNNAHIMILDIKDYNSSTYKIYQLKSWYVITDGSGSKQFWSLDGAIQETNVVSSIEIFASATFGGGTYQLYGIK